MNGSVYLTSSALVRTGPGSLLRGVLTAGDAAAGSLVFYDNTAGSGDILATLKAPQGTSVPFELDIVVSKGLYGTLAGTGAVATVVYR